jgi:hypothetical protein
MHDSASKVKALRGEPSVSEGDHQDKPTRPRLWEDRPKSGLIPTPLTCLFPVGLAGFELATP